MSAPSKSLWVIAIALLISFNAQAQGRQAYSRLSYNGMNYNRLIIDRFPDYGFAGKDGCVVMAQIDLAFRDIDSLTVEGLVKDAETGQNMMGATIRFRRRNGSRETVVSDSTGRFLVNRSSPVKEFEVLYVGYRILKIKSAPWKLF